MKGKRYTTEEKIRIMREADGGKTVNEVCRTHNDRTHLFEPLGELV